MHEIPAEIFETDVDNSKNGTMYYNISVPEVA